MEENEKNLNLKELKEYAAIVSETTKPWKHLCIWLLCALIATNLFWGINQMYITYKSYEPENSGVSVEQDFEGKTQTYENTKGEVPGGQSKGNG